MRPKRLKRIKKLYLIFGLFLAGILFAGFHKIAVHTSTDQYCAKCHLHPHATDSWKQGVHYATASGVQVHCVDCHLPPKGEGYFPEKVKTGVRDLYGAWFKDSASFNWELKSRPENAIHFTRDISCVHCHANLYPLELSRKGIDAHLYYDQQEGEVTCIKCHIDAGHFSEGSQGALGAELGQRSMGNDTIYLKAAEITGFYDYTETIPGSSVSFVMKAIPGGTFTMGAEEGDAYADEDEFPGRQVQIDSFFMAEIEVSWDEFLTWYGQTSKEGRTTDVGLLEGIDGVTGATPPYGNPDQGWGKGKRPAITMTYYAARKYCEWLSVLTGKKYRLPYEAEWEYAAKAGVDEVYFFGGSVKDYSASGLKGRLFGVDTAVINSYVVYEQNSGAKTQEPSVVKSSAFGLKNMLGNVAEFCMDSYSKDAYAENKSIYDRVSEEATNTVIRGGSYLSNAEELRVTNRDRSRHDAWMKTDPQLPKSKWWYSDCSHVGFRVVCEYQILKQN